MYQVECDGYIVHKGNSLDASLHAITGLLKNEVNRSGSFTFKVDSSNTAHSAGHIKLLKSIIKIYSIILEDKTYATDPDVVISKKLIWKGRVISTNRDFNNQMEYACEGWLGVLNDTIVIPILGSSNITIVDGDISEDEEDDTLTDGAIAVKWSPNKMFEYLITEYNKCADSDKQLIAHTVSSTIGDSIYYFPDPDYESTLDYFVSNFLDNEEVGGHVIIDDNDIYYYPKDADFKDAANQSISFGENLLDLKETYNGDEIFTCAVMSCESARTIVEYPSLVSKYGKIWKHFHYDADFGTDNNTAYAYLTQQFNILIDEVLNFKPTIEVSALDLSIVDMDISAIKVGMYVVLNSDPHDISAAYQCKEVEIDICNPENSKVSLGGVPYTLTPVSSGFSRKYKDPFKRTMDGTRIYKGTIEFYTS